MFRGARSTRQASKWAHHHSLPYFKFTGYRTARVVFSERYENRPDVKALQAWVEFQRPQHKPETKHSHR